MLLLCSTACTANVALKIGVGLASRADVGVSCLPGSGADIAGVIIQPVPVRHCYRLVKRHGGRESYFLKWCLNYTLYGVHAKILAIGQFKLLTDGTRTILERTLKQAINWLYKIVFFDCL